MRWFCGVFDDYIPDQQNWPTGDKTTEGYRTVIRSVRDEDQRLIKLHCWVVLPRPPKQFKKGDLVRFWGRRYEYTSRGPHKRKYRKHSVRDILLFDRWSGSFSEDGIDPSDYFEQLLRNDQKKFDKVWRQWCCECEDRVIVKKVKGYLSNVRRDLQHRAKKLKSFRLAKARLFDELRLCAYITRDTGVIRTLCAKHSCTHTMADSVALLNRPHSGTCAWGPEQCSGNVTETKARNALRNWEKKWREKTGSVETTSG